jgi:phosphatidate cytidylyltransferase
VKGVSEKHLFRLPRRKMLFKRVIVGLVLLPLASFFIWLGGWPYALGITAMLCIAGWEYWRMTHNGGYSPSLILLIGGIMAFGLVQLIFQPAKNEYTFSLLILATMTVSVCRFELGEDLPASNFALNIAGLVYLGWMGSYLISLRNLPDGIWWVAITLPAAWASDVGAFFVGSQIGKHRMAPRVSPRKSWEGYFGGLPFAVAWSVSVAWFAQGQVASITPIKGALLGLAIGLTAPLGDLFESLLKRQFGIKDTSHILPGHGGIMDRIDSTLWTGVISFFLISLFML